MKTYKIIKHYDTQALENKINEYARKGFYVQACSTDEGYTIVIMERIVEDSAP